MSTEMSKDEAATKSGGGIGETIRVVVEALLIALVIRTFAYQPFNIPSGSLIPTLLVGDYLFVSKFSYGYSRHSFPFSIMPIEGRFWAAEPKRGDIAVFKLPRDGETDYIKRVIGLPGDRIQVINGRLHINRQIVPKVADGFTEGLDAFGRPSRVPRYKETLPNGVTYSVQEIAGDNAIGVDNTDEYLVPAGHYFMMGDNRDNSADSRDRSVGFVPFENFVGRAEVIFFSLDEGTRAWELWKWPQDVRWGRIFQRIR